MGASVGCCRRVGVTGHTVAGRVGVSMLDVSAVSGGQVLACANVVLQVRVSSTTRWCWKARRTGSSLIRAGRTMQAMDVWVPFVQVGLEPPGRAQAGQGGQGAGGDRTNSPMPRLCVTSRSVGGLRDLLGPEVTTQLRERLSQKMEPPKTVEDKLAEKKRELDKKRAYGVTLQDQHTQPVEKIEQRVARMHKLSELVFQCQHQIAVLEYEELRAEFQAGPSQMVIEEVELSDELDSAAQPLPRVVMSLSLRMIPIGAKNAEMASWILTAW